MQNYTTVMWLNQSLHHHGLDMEPKDVSELCDLLLAKRALAPESKSNRIQVTQECRAPTSLYEISPIQPGEMRLCTKLGRQELRSNNRRLREVTRRFFNTNLAMFHASRELAQVANWV